VKFNTHNYILICLYAYNHINNLFHLYYIDIIVVFVFVVLFSVYSNAMHICLYYLLYSCLIMLCYIYVDEINNNNI